MKQLEDKHICKYCWGCIAEELENFKPKMNCKNFMPAYSDWQERYYKALKEKKCKINYLWGDKKNEN